MWDTRILCAWIICGAGKNMRMSRCESWLFGDGWVASSPTPLSSSYLCSLVCLCMCRALQFLHMLCVDSYLCVARPVFIACSFLGGVLVPLVYIKETSLLVTHTEHTVSVLCRTCTRGSIAVIVLSIFGYFANFLWVLKFFGHKKKLQ